MRPADLVRSRYGLSRHEARITPEEQAESDRIDRAMEAERQQQGRLWTEELERRLRPATAVQEKAPRRRPRHARLALQLAALGLGLRRRR